MHKDDTVFMESYEKLLESWTCLTRDMSSLPPETLIYLATDIFNSYMQCHLSAPDGIRNSVCQNIEVVLFKLMYICF